MYILGDIGNSETKVYLINPKNKIIRNISLTTKKISKEILNQKFRYLVKDFKSIKKILFCSVVPKSFGLIKKFLSKNLQIKCYEVKELKLGSLINIKVNFKQVGSDRLTNAISLLNNKDNFIILDFGTATTFDVIKNNVYIGGTIAPGIIVSHESLIKKASKLKNISIKKISSVIGKNTEQSMRAGFYWGYVNLINGIITKIIKEKQYKPKIILTGGLAQIYKKEIKFNSYYEPNLTLEGLYLIGIQNHD